MITDVLIFSIGVPVSIGPVPTIPLAPVVTCPDAPWVVPDTDVGPDVAAWVRPDVAACVVVAAVEVEVELPMQLQWIGYDIISRSASSVLDTE